MRLQPIPGFYLIVQSSSQKSWLVNKIGLLAVQGEQTIFLRFMKFYEFHPSYTNTFNVCIILGIDLLLFVTSFHANQNGDGEKYQYT